MIKIAVIIATTGRRAILTQMLTRLERQTRTPDRIVVVGAADDDLPRRDEFPAILFAIGPKGSSRQRNLGIDMLDPSFDLLVFLDDDFVPARSFVAGALQLMADNPDVVAASGRVLADGLRSAGLSFPEADAILAAHEAGAPEPATLTDQPGAYGCNMIIRSAAHPQARFDENMPLFGWLEDLDYSRRFAAVGRVVETSGCVGVHLGAKVGRTPAVLLGYSQVANPLYIAAKGILTRRQARWMVVRNVLANLARSLAPEPFIDRRGRLQGNLLALRHLAGGQCRPDRLLDLQDRELSI